MAFLYYDPRQMATTRFKLLIREPLDVPPGFGKLAGSAYYDAANRYVVLTRAVNGQLGYLYYNITPPPCFYCRFEFWTGGGTGADAMWLSVYASSASGEEDKASHGGYMFTFDEYTGNTYGGSRMAFNRGDNKDYQINPPLGYVSVPRSYFMNGQWHVAEVWFCRDSNGVWCRMSLDNGAYVLSKIYDKNPQPNALASRGIIFFGARTGGLNNEHRIRNILFYTLPTDYGIQRVTIS